jgi:hypothetical protein
MQPPAVSSRFNGYPDRTRKTVPAPKKVDGRSGRAPALFSEKSVWTSVQKVGCADTSIDLEQMQRDIELLRCQKTSLESKNTALIEQAKADVHTVLAEKAQLEFQIKAQGELRVRQYESQQMHQDNSHIERENFMRNKEVFMQELQELRSERARRSEKEDLLHVRDAELVEVRTALKEHIDKEAEMIQENQRLTLELSQLQVEKGSVEIEMERLKLHLEGEIENLRHCLEEKPLLATSACSEGRLRAALAHSDTTNEQLNEAISAVEALLGEAKREQSSRQLRDQRAAYERLHAAETEGSEHLLVEAIAEAERTRVDEEDVARAMEKLKQVRSLTDEQKAAKVAKDLETQRKARAFLLVKKDDGTQLARLLEQVDTEGCIRKWQDWRDHSGRTLSQFARELRATSAQRSLTQLLSSSRLESTPPADENHDMLRPTNYANLDSGNSIICEKVSNDLDAIQTFTSAVMHSPAKSQCPVSLQHQVPPLISRSLESTRDHTISLLPPSDTMQTVAVDLHMQVSTESATAEESTTFTSEMHALVYPEHGDERVPTGEESEWKTQALRAVVADDVRALEEIFDRLPVEAWSKWKNKAGKDLLTLSQERGSTLAYSLLARRLGLLKELKQEGFEEREDVWVLIHGELQPRRATVCEDTAEDAQEVLVEFWDGYEPATRVDRCMVMKTNS